MVEYIAFETPCKSTVNQEGTFAVIRVCWKLNFQKRDLNWPNMAGDPPPL
jgi:hypothetical protein